MRHSSPLISLAAAFILLLGMNHAATAQPTPSSQVQALQALYHATNGSQWTSYCSSLWLSDEPPCSWFGVTCDGNNSVVELTLGSCNLQGTLPPTLDALTSLQYLSLSGNKIAGSLPSWTQFANIQAILLADNLLESTLPDAWGNLTSLQHLTLANNRITSALPNSWGNLYLLELLTLNNNPLSTTLPIAWGQLWSMGHLDLSNASISGILPGAWCAVMPGYLNLSHNAIIVLDDFENPDCVIIGVLDVSYNHLYGDFPRWASLTYGGTIIASHTHLSIPCHWRLGGDSIDVSHNNIHRLPSMGCSLQGFANIDLSWNEMSGDLIELLSMFSNIQSLNLAGNGLTGSLPPMLDPSFSACVYNGAGCNCSINLDQTPVFGTIPEFYCQYPLSWSFVHSPHVTPPSCTPTCPMTWNTTTTHSKY